MYFYDLQKKAFLVEGLHQIPTTAKAVTEKEFNLLIDGRNKGREIVLMGNTLTLTSPRPSQAHEWNGREWVISQDKQAEFFNQKKEALIRRIANKTDRLKDSILVAYPQAEIDSFYRQEKEALTKKANPNAETPMLSSIALSRGVSLDNLVDKVLAKAELFASIMGNVIGQRQKFEDRTLSAETLEQLTDIEIEVDKWQLSI
ncbi:hypothetical protein [Avibacterium sp. 20-129]|uniref:hypothetical protein n=1 Tax=Avibacterium sp. 20-129 TaxID=2911525 RepID=UPI002246DB69|nr:hypothetical protein [Avibacterium sp. 20-129]MCW9699512.1 hypothetical protein [Avibacterium sp. 20-129]